MSGSKANEATRAQVVRAVRAIPEDKLFAWDGVSEDERPLSRDEMQQGMALAAKRRGRPAGSGTKEQVAIRLDHDVLAAFRAMGPGWQTRINAALGEWLRTQQPKSHG